eukprot:5149406-Pleurochrysis_carterae.AAC.2
MMCQYQIASTHVWHGAAATKTSEKTARVRTHPYASHACLGSSVRDKSLCGGDAHAGRCWR